MITWPRWVWSAESLAAEASLHRLDANEVAVMLGATRPQVYLWVRKGLTIFVKHGGVRGKVFLDFFEPPGFARKGFSVADVMQFARKREQWRTKGGSDVSAVELINWIGVPFELALLWNLKPALEAHGVGDFYKPLDTLAMLASLDTSTTEGGSP